MKGARASPELPASPRSGGPWQSFVEKEAPVSENAKHVSKSLRWAHRALWLDVTLYVFFLLTFILSALVPFAQIAWNGFQIVNTFTQFAAAVEWPDPSNTFNDIHSVVDFWSWWQGPFRDIALGFNNYADSEDDAARVRRDHRAGHILDMAVVGTVRLRQQRAVRHCGSPNRLDVHPADTLCYLNAGRRAHESRDDWAWPAFAVPLSRGAAEPLPPETEASVAGARGAKLAGERAAGAPPKGAPDAPIAPPPPGAAPAPAVAVPAADAAAPIDGGAAAATPAAGGAVADAPAADELAADTPVAAADVAPADADAAATPLSGDVPAEPPAVDAVGAAPAEAVGTVAPVGTDGGAGEAAGAPDGAADAAGLKDGRWSGGRRGFAQPQGLPPGGLPLSQLRRHLLQAAPAAAPAAVPEAVYDLGNSDAPSWSGVPPPPGADEDCMFVDRLSYWGFVGAALDRTCATVEARKRELLARTPAFVYRNHSALSAAGYLSTNALRVYNGGGYAHDFNVRDAAGFDAATALLRDASWLDGATRFAVVEFALFSAPTRLLATAFFMIEVHGSGVATPRLGYEVFSVATYRHNFLGRGRVGVDVAFVALCTVIFLSDVLSVVRHNHALERRWYSNPFFWMSVIMWCATVAVVVLRFMTARSVGNFDPEAVAPASDPDGAHWPRLHGIASNLRVERSLIALLSFCVWLRVFKYTRSVPGFGTIGRTIMRAFPAIFTYVAMSAVVFLGFAQSFFLGFYTSNAGFQTLPESLMSMVRFTSGDVDFASLQRANNTLAPLLYTMALFVLAFVWTSLLLAIVLNAYYLEAAAEGSFEFDKVFRDFGLANPLLKRHPDYDEAALTAHHLTPALYNRFVLNTLARFNPATMGVMAMSDFLARARLGTAHAPPDAGETQPLGALQRGGGGGVAWDAASAAHGQATDSSDIIIRWGALRGVRGPLDIHALYFPRSMDEHRCRAWWMAHKHYLRVGDAVYRNVAAQLKTVRQLAPLKQTYKRVTSVKSRASWVSRGKRARGERGSHDAAAPAAHPAENPLAGAASAASSMRSSGSARHAREHDVSAASSVTAEGVPAPPQVGAAEEGFRWRAAGGPRLLGSLRRRDTGASEGP